MMVKTALNAEEPDPEDWVAWYRERYRLMLSRAARVLRAAGRLR